MNTFQLQSALRHHRGINISEETVEWVLLVNLGITGVTLKLSISSWPEKSTPYTLIVLEFTLS